MRPSTTIVSLLAFSVAPSLSEAFVATPRSSLAPHQYHQSTFASGRPTGTGYGPLALAASNASDDEKETKNNWQFNPFYGGLLAGFLGYGLLSPGEFFSDVDNGMIQAFIDNPAAPVGLNELFLCVFNGLGILPLVLSQLVFPQGSKQGLPATPFCLASAAMGYGGLGMYMTFRAQPVDSKTQSELGWVTRNFLENKLVNWGIVVLTASVLVSSGILDQDLGSVWSGFQDLTASSKLASVSSVDLCVLTVTAATLIPRDYRLRNPEQEEDQSTRANLIAASTILFPIAGAALYCALRPALPED